MKLDFFSSDLGLKESWEYRPIKLGLKILRVTKLETSTITAFELGYE